MSQIACQKHPTSCRNGPELGSLTCSTNEKKPTGRMILAQVLLWTYMETSYSYLPKMCLTVDLNSTPFSWEPRRTLCSHRAQAAPRWFLLAFFLRGKLRKGKVKRNGTNTVSITALGLEIQLVVTLSRQWILDKKIGKGS